MSIWRLEWTKSFISKNKGDAIEVELGDLSGIRCNFMDLKWERRASSFVWGGNWNCLCLRLKFLSYLWASNCIATNAQLHWCRRAVTTRFSHIIYIKVKKGEMIWHARAQCIWLIILNKLKINALQTLFINFIEISANNLCFNIDVAACVLQWK